MASRLNSPLVWAPADPPPIAKLGPFVANSRARPVMNSEGVSPRNRSGSPILEPAISGRKASNAPTPRPSVKASTSTPSACKPSEIIT